MRIIRLTVSIYIGLASIASAQDKTITIATEGAFPPWNAVDTSGVPIGFDIDVGKALCEKAQLTCTFVTQAWDGIIPALSVGKFDAIMAGMSITERRKQVISFSDPYALTSNYFVVSKELGLPAMDGDTKLDLSESANTGALLQTLKKNLSGRTVGVQGSTNAEAFVRDYLGNGVTVRTYDKQDNLNLDLASGRIDAGLADYSVWKTFLETADGQKATLYGPRISGGPFGPGIGIGLRKEDKELETRFNAAIGELRRTGQLRAMSEKWFGADLVSR